MPEWSLAGQRVLVTGASAGIGAALAEGFAARGAVVAICARRADRLDAVLARLRHHEPRCRAYPIDLGELDGLEEFAHRVVGDLGGLDLLVNNAGIPKRRIVTDLTPAEVETTMRVNFLSPVRLTLALLPELIDRRGRIVFVSSVAARLSPPHESAYAASKAAICAFAESMQVDLGDTGVRVHLLHPGVIETDLFSHPDNEATLADLDPLPVEAVVEPVVSMLADGTLEVYVPEWFGEIAKGKASDPQAFLEGSIEWTRSRRGEG